MPAITRVQHPCVISAREHLSMAQESLKAIDLRKLPSPERAVHKDLRAMVAEARKTLTTL